jgi:hypothetical protein
VPLILSVTLSRTVAVIGIPSDGVNFWFLAELNHGRLRDAVSQTPAINQTLTIPVIFRMPRALSFGDVGWFTPRRWRLVGRPMHGQFGTAVGPS